MKTFFVGVKGVIREQRGILLVRHNEGHWDVPGGRMDGDEAFEDTLRRELAEEVPGTQLKEVGDLLGAHRLQKDIKGDISLVLLYFQVSAVVPQRIELGDEHAEYLWVSSVEDIPSTGVDEHLDRILKEVLAK